MAELLNLIPQNRRPFRKHFLSSVHSELRFSGLDIKRVLKNQVALETAMRDHGFTECRPIVQGNLKLPTITDYLDLDSLYDLEETEKTFYQATTQQGW